MSSPLAVALEPSDALVGLLRLKAVSEAERWPPEISRAFRKAIDAEFHRAEETVRTIGLCYADLEESSVAEINRAPQSRFDDIDAALHLAACPVRISLDLDHLRMAFDRGDAPARESAAGLVNSLRTLLWYLARTELLVCTRLALGERETPPERALDFVDGCFAHALEVGPPADPPAPPVHTEPVEPETDAEATNSFTFGTPLPTMEHTAVLTPSAEMQALVIEDTNALRAMPDPDPPTGSHAAGLSEDARFFLFQADIPESDWPLPRPTLLAARRAVLRRLDPEQAGTHSADLHASAERGSAELLRLLDTIGTRPRPSARPGAGLQTTTMQASDLLSEDARFFLSQSGTPWPCDLEQLSQAHESLLSRLSPSGLLGQRMLARVERGYLELSQLASGPG